MSILKEGLGSLKAAQEPIDPGRGIAVLDCDFLQRSVVRAHSLAAILALNHMQQSRQHDKLGALGFLARVACLTAMLSP